jgi:hypothetical protein
MGDDISQQRVGSPADELGQELLNLFTFFVTGRGPQAPTEGEAAPFLEALANTERFGVPLTPEQRAQLERGGGLRPDAPINQTSLVAEALKRQLQGVDLAPTGEALQTIIQRQSERDVADLRARFGASGGTAFGTPAAVGESLFRAETGPRIAAALGELGLRGQALDAQRVLQLLSIIAQLSSRGVEQARTEVIVSQDPFARFLDTAAGGASAAADVRTAFGRREG